MEEITMDKPFITPRMKVYELLKQFPELEEPLIEFIPEFQKLRNPILRKTITRVTSLEQAAKVGGVTVEKLINFLRLKSGQESIEIKEAVETTEIPEWFSTAKISKVLDVRPVIESGDHPIALVLEETDKLQSGQILELITPFYPAPLIDTIVGRGFKAHTEKLSSNFVKCYFLKP